MLTTLLGLQCVKLACNTQFVEEIILIYVLQPQESHLLVWDAEHSDRLKHAYEIFNLRTFNFIFKHIFQCMSEVLRVWFQRYPLKCHLKYLVYSFKDVYFIKKRNFASCLKLRARGRVWNGRLMWKLESDIPRIITLLLVPTKMSSVDLLFNLETKTIIIKVPPKWRHMQQSLVAYDSSTQRCQICGSDSYGNVSSWLVYNRPVAQIPQCTRPISHDAPFCNRNVHTCAHFCYKIVHCGISVWCIVGFVNYGDAFLMHPSHNGIIIFRIMFLWILKHLSA